jgi:thioredoxin-like negative regulator of GroEL
MRPLWREISEKFPQVEIVDIDFDEHPEEAKKFAATKVPMTIFFDTDGNEIYRHQGMHNKLDLIKLIEENLDK